METKSRIKLKEAKVQKELQKELKKLKGPGSN